jgi:hypothetical protein
LIRSRVLITACLSLSQKVNETEVAKIRDILNAVTLSSQPPDINESENQAVADLQRIGLSYADYPALRDMVLTEEQNVVKAINFDFTRRTEQMMSTMLVLAEKCGMKRPDI